ncbi:MAG: hypothetical protein ACE5DY_00130 [Mariprofundaceae bacterium]
MRQRLLNFEISPAHSYGEWIRHAGIEPVHNRIALWLVHGGRLWLSSGEPSGKTHFLKALQQEHPFLGLLRLDQLHASSSISEVQKWLDFLDPYAFWLVDVPAGALPYATGTALFHLIERARTMQRPFLVSWRCPEEELAPPELSSRLKAMDRLAMPAPHSDEDLRAVLRSVATSRQWQVDAAIIDLLILHLPRKLTTLIEALHVLERTSLEERRSLNKTWARQFLRCQQEKDAQTGLFAEN